MTDSEGNRTETDSMGTDRYTALDTVRTGRRIRGVIRENGCSVRKLQSILHLSCPQPVYRWMNGYTLPSVDNLYMMHRIFGIHMEDMLVAVDEADTGDNGGEE